MKDNKIFKILASLPVILIALYFIPFLGICLILFRYFVYDNKKRISTPMYIIEVGILVLIPKVLKLILDTLKINIPYLNEIVNSSVYNVNFINYSKLLICVGIIFLIIIFVFRVIFEKVSSKLNNEIRNYISKTQKRDYEISKQNDMEIKIKQEKAKNTSYVRCQNCGSDNLISDKFGICKYCRRKIVNKNFK